MAVEPTNTASAVWHDLVALRDEVIHTLENNGRDPAIERQLAAIEDQLLVTSAPTLADIAFKLDLLWGDAATCPDHGGRSKASILQDIRSRAEPR